MKYTFLVFFCLVIFSCEFDKQKVQTPEQERQNAVVRDATKTDEVDTIVKVDEVLDSLKMDTLKQK